jgi:hypothetical protein
MFLDDIPLSRKGRGSMFLDDIPLSLDGRGLGEGEN